MLDLHEIKILMSDNIDVRDDLSNKSL